MKFLLMMTLLTFSLSTQAAAVDGEIFYKLPNGDLATRNVTLEVPSRGQGEVVLSNSKFEWRTSNFKTVKLEGKTYFIAVFKTQFRQFKSTVVLKGKYLRGNNKLVYYGDMYKKDGHVTFDNSFIGFDYNGGFNFAYDL